MANTKKGLAGTIALIVAIVLVIAAIAFVVLKGESTKSKLLDNQEMADCLAETLGKSQRSITEADIATIESATILTYPTASYIMFGKEGYLEKANAEEIDPEALQDYYSYFDYSSLGISNLSEFMTDFRFFTGLRDLTILYTDLSDFSFTENMTKLETLTMSANYECDDYSFVSKLPSLKTLSLSDCEIEDASFVKDLTGLESLDLSSNQIRDISALSGLKELNTLNLGYNVIEDVSPIADLTKLERIYLASNALEDVSMLTNYNPENFEIITLDLNPWIKDFSALDYLGEYKVLLDDD